MEEELAKNRHSQNLHWKLGQQMPSVGTLLAYLEMVKPWSQLGYSESQNLPNLPTDGSKKMPTVGE